MSKTADQITEIIESVIEEQGYELVDVEFLKEGSDWFLRVYIDHEKGIMIDDCAKISQIISVLIDEQDPIAQEYMLEVSSPGIERVLKKDKDFVRFKGNKVKIKLFAKFLERKQYVGEILDSDQQTLQIKTDDEVVNIPRELISKANLCWDDK